MAGEHDASTTLPLEDYSVVGDLRTLAVVGVHGSVDWMCWPRFDSPSIFGALLDTDGGHWSIEADGEVEARRQVYLSGTNVLMTRFHICDALVEVEDFMTLGDDGQHLVRAVRCRRGTVEMVSEVAVRPDYGRAAVTLDDGGGGDGVRVSADGAHRFDLVLSGTVDWTIEGDVATTRFTLQSDEVAYLALGDGPMTLERCDGAHERTSCWWRDWTDRSNYRGRWREAVERSALVLKLLTHEETGGIVAAGTASVPEVLGGERNWDYRYVWIRDAAFTVYAFIKLGHLDEAVAFTEWLVRRLDDCDTGGKPLSPLYDLDGATTLDEVHLDHWKGYAGSRPVRVGNAASDQLQLDIYGEMVDALYLSDKYGDGVSVDTWRHIGTIVDWLGDHWEEPDDGIWEARSGPRTYTSSLMMCWVAVERAIRMADRRGRPAPLDTWRTLRDEMHERLIDRGFNRDVGAFTQVLGGDAVDASILLAPLVKFISPSDPLWLSTLDVVADRLSHGPLTARYGDATDDGFDGDEGSFTICSFWYVEALARSGRVDEARILFDRLLSYSGPTGIFSEEIGRNGRLAGNLPQAFTHLALISAATYLDRALDDPTG